MRTAFVLTALLVAGSVTGASAQQVRTATIQPDKPTRLRVITALKKDCSLGAVGSIRVTGNPKNGSIVIQSGKLKTPATFRCPNVETQAQMLIYKPNKGFQGVDEVAYETSSAEGETIKYTDKINITSKPPAAKPGQGGVVDL